MSTWALERYLDPEGYLTADGIRTFIDDACPEMARVLRSMVLTISDPDPDDLSEDEHEVWVRLQLADLADLAGIDDVLPEAMPGNSHPTLKDG